MAFEVDYITLSPSDASSRTTHLAGVPSDTSMVAMDIVGGTAQYWSSGPASDFHVTDSTVKWDYSGSPLYPLLTVGDKLRFIYDKTSTI